MTKQTVNVGLAVGDGKGEPTRSAFVKLNSNFDEVYSMMGNGTSLHGKGTSGSVFGLLNTDNTHGGNNTHSGNNTFSGSNTFSKTILIGDNLKYDGAPNYMVKGASANNKNYGYVATAASDTTAGSVELGVLGDVVKPIYARQRNAAGAILKSLTLLDAAGDTTIPGRMLIYPNVASGNAGLILGNQTTANNTYVDFSPTASTYVDARIEAKGGGGANYGGTLNYYATENVFAGKVTVNGQLSASNVAITGGAINGTPIGATTPSTGKFSSIALTTDLAIADGGTGASTAAAARQNLDVYSKTEVNAAITNATPQATQSNVGLIEIATPTEALAGTDQTKALTPANLKNALSASGDAPMFACRAWVNFNATPLGGTYTQSGTLVTVTMTAHGMSVGQVVNLSVTSGTGVSGIYTVASVDSANTFTYVAGTSLTTSGNITRNNYIRASGNVLSVIDNGGVGDYTINFATQMPTASYIILGSVVDTLGGGASIKTIGSAITALPTLKTTLAVRIGIGTSGSSFDCSEISIAIIC